MNTNDLVLTNARIVLDDRVVHGTLISGTALSDSSTKDRRRHLAPSIAMATT
jgi:hypothetical protein